MEIIRANRLTKTYNGNTVVNGIDFSVTAGTCFGLLGPNGAGKTTTLRMILGLSPPGSGELRLFDRIDELDEIRMQCGVVPQLDNLDPDFTVAENLQIYASYFGLDHKTLGSRIRSLLEFVNLSDRADARIDTLSGGMQRRLTIARALVNDPQLIVLDEPTTGLDPQARHMIWQRLRDLVDAGKTLLLTTHYMEEAERLCDRLAIMDRGDIIAQGSPADLIATHAAPEVVEIRRHYDRIRPLLEHFPRLRKERAGDTMYVYGDEVKLLVEEIEKTGDVGYIHRHSNLEDVFLRLTGRELRD